MPQAHSDAWHNALWPSVSLQPTHTHKYERICRRDLYYYHRDKKVTRKLFISRQRPCAVTLLLLVLPGLWSSLSLNRVHYSSPGVTKNGFFSQRPGVTHPATACARPPPSPHPGQTAILLTPVTEILEPPALCSHPLVARGDGAWWITEKPRSIVAPNTVHTATLLFCFQFMHNACRGSLTGKLELFIFVHGWCLAEKPTSRQLEKILLCLMVIRQTLLFLLLLWLQSRVWQFTLGSFQLYHMVFICRFLVSHHISYMFCSKIKTPPVC